MGARIRRCAVLFLQPVEELEFDLSLLLQGEAGLHSAGSWQALAPHLAAPVRVDAAACALLGTISDTLWTEASAIAPEVRGMAERLLAEGLLVSDDPAHAHHHTRDEAVRAQYWHPLAAAAHAFSRWESVSATQAARDTGIGSIQDMVQRLGPAPPHHAARCEPAQRIALQPPGQTAFDSLLAARITCRNFDSGRALEARLFSRLLHRVFGAQASWEAAADTFVVKKTSPSGGGLHATEAYLLVRNVEGIVPGLYHYHAGEHALEPIDLSSPETLGARAERFVAGQHWFADAQVLVALAPRFRRSFWKYRNHAKAYRALVLDAGHLSQTLYISATECGLGAFVTAAINEVEIERAFGLDPVQESPLAVCGFGWRAATRTTVEFDPLHLLWPDGDAVRDQPAATPTPPSPG